RLEEFTGAVVEQASGRMVVQYRGGILPLINLSNFFNKDKTQCCEYADDDLVNVIVFRCGTRAVGFIVGEILDIVHEALDIQYAQGREGILGSAVVQKKITDVLDTHTVLQILEPRLLEESESQQQGA
ncbi:MAG: chemotaxis protein CheW, partial [Bdellovibrionales bacterium]|nr:chemotaxis protein CheW [Bdellovibrionales bacterium]